MKELLDNPAVADVVTKAAGYLIAVALYGVGSWLARRLRARMPDQLVDRMWDSYLHPVAKWAWGEAQDALKRGDMPGAWQRQIISEAMRRLEMEWECWEERPLSTAQAEAAQEELESVVERAVRGVM